MLTFAELRVIIRSAPEGTPATADEFIEELARLEGLHPALRSARLRKLGALRAVAEECLDIHITRRSDFLRRLRGCWELATICQDDYRKAG